MNGPELKKWRKLLGYTQEQAANEFGVTRPTIQNWEYEITPVPVAVDLASRQLLRSWKQRPEFGPVTLVYASAPLGPTLNGEDRLPTLFCKRYPDNKSAFLGVSELRSSSNFFNPLILDDTNLVIWSGPQLMEECKKKRWVSKR
ncbi:MAG TPA: helix-turn-helix transcriptional regulator [Sedimentisphaerales bacterium]